jgi:hypothetical protein
MNRIAHSGIGIFPGRGDPVFEERTLGRIGALKGLDEGPEPVDFFS